MSNLPKEVMDIWINGRKRLPEIDYDDFPQEYVVRIKGDDPRSGWIYCGMMTAEKMREVNEDGYWEWLDEAAALHYSAIIEEKDKEIEELKTNGYEPWFQTAMQNYVENYKKKVESEIEQLKAENEEYSRNIKNAADINSKLLSQIKGLIEGLEEARDRLSRREVARHILVDTLTNYYNSK